jgi:preprotein translocase subunit SecD
MHQRQLAWLAIILLVVLGAIYVVIPGSGIHLTLGTLTIDHDFDVHQGLDLQGGLQVLLEADVPAGTEIDDRAMEDAKAIVENRVNALGLAEPVVQRQGDRRLVVELPGISNPQQAIETLKQTALLEFVQVGTNPPPAGTVIRTDCIDPTRVDCGNPTGTMPLPTPVPGSAAEDGTTAPTGPVYHTAMTGVGLREAIVTRGELGEWLINFTLTDEGSRIFGDFTARHIGESLAIVLDKTVLSAPTINDAITGGSGTISGNFTQVSANQLALQLRYGSLPVPLTVVQSREIGPSLGQDSVRRSAVAGVIGLTIVGLFMAFYYRLPGLIAVVALLIYALVTFSLFILIPVTLTLPGIAGFVLSVGVAVDANILIFERMKEELRGGRSLRQAVEIGFSRAWSSIRDSNISTLITCAILFWFANTFGASIVKGFALTLALGVGVSLFTAILVTRTILHIVLDRLDLSNRTTWLGV